MYNCNLCSNDFNGSLYNLRNLESKEPVLSSIIENIVGNIECLEDISYICKDCNELLLEMHILNSRMLEIQNIIKRYVEKKQQMLAYLSTNNLLEIDKNIKEEKQITSTVQQTPIQELELFEEIIENSCKSEIDHYKHEEISYVTEQINDQSNFENKNKKQILETQFKEQKSKYICHCTQVFCSSGELKKHSKTHSDEQPFVCELCGKSYKQKTGFEIHIKMHEGVNPFKCIYCNKSFTQKIALIRHVPIHTGKYM